jgi:hypothetical protein
MNVLPLPGILSAASIRTYCCIPNIPGDNLCTLKQKCDIYSRGFQVRSCPEHIHEQKICRGKVNNNKILTK